MTVSATVSTCSYSYADESNPCCSTAVL